MTTSGGGRGIHGTDTTSVFVSIAEIGMNSTRRCVYHPLTDDMEGAPAESVLDVAETDPLEECVVNGSHPKLYRVVQAYARIEGCTPTQAGTRWSSQKHKFTDLHIQKHGVVLCLDEESMVTVLKSMRETENKSRALRARGIEDDQDPSMPRIRELVLHTDGPEARIEVRRCY
jgi:hypothetical protein